MITRQETPLARRPGNPIFRTGWRRRAKLGLATIAGILAACSSALLGQPAANPDTTPASAEFAIEIWRTENGLPQNTVTAILQTHRGYILAGTYNGLVQFDGLRFKVFDSSNTKGLANSQVTGLHEDGAGGVWIGHDSGEVTRYDGANFSRVTLNAAWGKAPIKDFAADETGALWVLNQLGEAINLASGRIVKPPPLMGENAFVNPRVVKDGRGWTYVVRNGVIAHFTAQGYDMIDFGEGSERPYYDGAAAAQDGQLWVVGQGLLRKWDGTNWTANLGTFPGANASVTKMLETSSGHVLVGTLQRGLYVYDALTGWSNLNRTNGLPQDWIHSLKEDREKNLWVGTGGGLALLRERKVTMLSPPDEWQGRPVLSIARAQDGAIWAATEGAGIYRFKDGGWSQFPVANPFVWSVFEDSKERVWAGTWGGGLFRLVDGEFLLQTNLVTELHPIVALKEFPQGTFWIGTGAGLVQVRSNVVERFNRLGGAAAGDVRAVEPGANGEVWIGAQGAGLGCFTKDGNFRTFQITDGVSGNFILSLLSEPDGTLWIGTLDMGLCRYKNGQFRFITTANGLPRNIIYHIEDDQLGNLWFNSPMGIFRVAKGELNACADGRNPNVEVLAYGTAEGMTTLAGTGGFTPSGFRAPDGRLWFSTARGIAVVAPKNAHRNPVRPPVWIEEVFVDGQSVPIEHPTPAQVARGGISPATRNVVVLQPGRRQMDVQFTGLSFTSPERVQFKYGIEGLDPDATPASTRRRVNYSFLSPGHYTFRVTACNSDGLWNEEGDSLAIVVLPHFWQTWWFKTLMAVLSAALLALIFFVESRRRLQGKLERIARERELERERSRIAQDIHDDLGASLTRIGMLSQSAVGDMDDPPRVTANLNQIYDTARDLTRAMDEIVWAVNPRHDTLESLTNYLARFAHEFLRAAGIRCRLETPMQVPEFAVRSEIRHNLFLAFKETLNNAVKHSGASEIRVTLELLPGSLKLGVADNGGGFNPRKSGTTPAGDRLISGYGMAGIRARLEQVGGRMDLQSQPGAGTRVELFVPLPAIVPTDEGWHRKTN